MKTKFILLVLIVFTTLFLAACGKQEQPAATSTVTDTPAEVAVTEEVSVTEAVVVTEAVAATNVSSNAEAIIQAQCTSCHGISRITSMKATAEQWKAIVERMNTVLMEWMASCGDKGQATEMEALQHQPQNKQIV